MSFFLFPATRIIGASLPQESYISFLETFEEEWSISPTFPQFSLSYDFAETFEQGWTEYSLFPQFSSTSNFTESFEDWTSALTFSASPSSISFSSSGVTTNVTISATGTGSESYNISNSNSTYFQVSPTSGTITGGGSVTIGITFTGNDPGRSATITFNGGTNNTSISVDSFSYSSGGFPPPG